MHSLQYLLGAGLLHCEPDWDKLMAVQFNLKWMSLVILVFIICFDFPVPSNMNFIFVLHILDGLDAGYVFHRN